MACYQGRCVNTSSIPGYKENLQCDPNPCQNGGTCVLNGLGMSYICDCSSGYEGIFCEIFDNLVSNSIQIL